MRLHAAFERSFRYDSAMTPKEPTAAAPETLEFLARIVRRDGRHWALDVLHPARELALEQSASVDPDDYVEVRQIGTGARLLRQVARAGSSRAELVEIFTHYALSPAFSDAVQAEVDEFERHTGLDDPDLVDLTDLPFVTIDGETSMDLDQAAYVERDAGGFVVYYALADASYYVRPGTALWDEAMRRAASYYLPEVMVPMLPRALSEGLVSLNPQVKRRALVLRTRLNDDGSLRDTGEPATDAFRARILSRAKLSFRGVQEFYEGKALAIDDEGVKTSLEHLRSVGVARRALAQEREVVRFRRVELDVQLDGRQRRRFIAAEAIRHPVEAYNEQLSLLCNSEGARLLREAASDPLIEPIYRVHPPPEEARLRELRELTRALAERHGLDERWIWHEGQHLADYLEGLPQGGTTDALALAINRQAVMVNVASTYQSLPERHFGVGAEVYARFSAPMREIVGIFLHRELLQALDGKGRDDKALRDEVIQRANDAKTIQKRITNEANLLVLDQIFGDQLALPETERALPATIVGLSRSKVYVLFQRYPIDAKVHLRDLRNALGNVSITDDGAAVEVDGDAKWRIGDRVDVVVVGHDVQRRHWRLGLR